MAHVFISYSSKHRALTEELAAYLSDCGLDVWWDRELVARGPYDAQIKDQLDKAACILVIWSQGAVESEWVKLEAEFALSHDKLVNVRDDVLSPNALPPPFDGIECHLLSERDLILRDALAVREGRLLLRDKREPLPPSGERTPTMLLQAKYAVVPYTGAVGLRDDAVAWACAVGVPPNGPRRSAGRHIHGPGGCGKTRVAIEIVDALRARGWSAGFLSAPDVSVCADERERQAKALSYLIRGANDQGLFLVLDYAESRAAEIVSLAQQIQSRPSWDDRPIRVLLLSRNAGDWWTRLHQEHPSVEALFAQGPGKLDVVQMPELVDPASRRALFESAVAALWPLLEEDGYAAPAGLSMMTDGLYGQGERHNRPLAVLMEVLLRLAGGLDEGSKVGVADLLGRVLGMERGHWRKLLGWSLDDSIGAAGVGLERSVGQITAVQGVPSVRAAEDLSMADRRYQGARDNRASVHDVVRQSFRLYGRGEGVAQLEPDLVGEHLVGQVFDVELIDGCLEWIASLPERESARRKQDLLTVLQRASRPEHGPAVTARVSTLLDHLILAYTETLATAMTTVMVETPGGLAARLAERLPELSAEALKALSGAMPRSTVTIARLAVDVQQAYAVALRRWATDGDRSFRAARIGAEQDLALRRAAVREMQAALDAAAEAEQLARAWYAEDPGESVELLVSVLRTGSQVAFEAGRNERARELGYEGLAFLRELQTAEPEKFAFYLASFLSNFGGALIADQLFDDAHNTVSEAAGILSTREFRTIEELTSAVYIYHHLAVCASHLNRKDEAAAHEETALSWCDVLVDTSRDEFVALHAMVQLGHANRLIDLERFDAALAQIEKALAGIDALGADSLAVLGLQRGKLLLARSRIAEKQRDTDAEVRDLEGSLRLLLPHSFTAEVDAVTLDTTVRSYLGACFRAKRIPNPDIVAAIPPLNGGAPKQSLELLSLITEALVTGAMSTALLRIIPRELQEGLTSLIASLSKRGTDAASDGDGLSNTISPRHGELASAMGARDAAAVELLAAYGGELAESDASRRPLLHKAVESGSATLVGALLACGADFEVTDIDGATELHIAARLGTLDILSALISHGADVDALDGHGWTPLERAIEYDQTACIRSLLEHGARVSASSVRDASPLRLAASIGRVDAIALIVKFGADVNEASSSLGGTPLVVAIEAGHEAAAIELVRRGAVLNDALGPNAPTPIHFAARAGMAELVAAMIDAGAGVASLAPIDSTTVHSAALGNNADIVTLLLSRGAPVDARDHAGFTPLHVASWKGSTNAMRALIEAGADLEAKTLDGLTPLLLCAKFGYPDGLVLLQEQGCDAAVAHQELSAAHWAAHNGHVKVLERLDVEALEALGPQSFRPLHLASQNGRRDVVRHLVGRGVDINAVTAEGATALHLAAYGGHWKLIADLVEARVELDARANRGETALSMALERGHEQFALALLQAGASPVVADDEGTTPLHNAAYHGLYMAARALVRRSADVNALARGGFAPLHIATQQNSLGVIKLLLQHGANVVRALPNGRTPLHLATAAGVVQAVQLLIARGADVNAQDSQGLTPLHIAAELGGTPLIKALLEAGAAVEVAEGRGLRPLHLACMKGQLENAQALIEIGADVRARDDKRASPLHFACMSSEHNLDLVRLLLSAGAEPDAINRSRLTPLHVAAQTDFAAAAGLLVASGASRDPRDEDGRTPLHDAAVAGHAKTAARLIAAGADVQCETKRHETPLHAAALVGAADIAAQLLGSGALCNAQAHWGWTPLHMAAQNGHEACVHILMEHGAVLDALNDKQKTARDLAIQQGHAKVAAILEAAGASKDHQSAQAVLIAEIQRGFDHVADIDIDGRPSAALAKAIDAALAEPVFRSAIATMLENAGQPVGTVSAAEQRQAAYAALRTMREANAQSQAKASPLHADLALLKVDRNVVLAVIKAAQAKAGDDRGILRAELKARLLAVGAGEDGINALLSQLPAEGSADISAKSEGSDNVARKKKRKPQGLLGALFRRGRG